MNRVWTVPLVISSIFLFHPMQVRAQSLREFDISSSDFMRPEPPDHSSPSSKPKKEPKVKRPTPEVSLEGPIPEAPPDPQKRQKMLKASAVIGFAGVGLELGALVTTLVAYGANIWYSATWIFTCGYHRHMDDEGSESIVKNECPEDIEAANDLERRKGIAGIISLAGGATLGAAGIFALSTILATRHSQPKSSAKASQKLVSQLRPTLSFDSNSFQVGLSLEL